MVGHATTEELTMIRDYIMLPHMLTMCDKSREDAKRSGNLFANHFARIIQIVMDDITRDLAVIRKEFNKRQIKVWDDCVDDGILYSHYTCRGYQQRFGIVRETLRSEISFRLAQYASQVFKPVVH
jgi:hypothetical protein